MSIEQLAAAMHGSFGSSKNKDIHEFGQQNDRCPFSLFLSGGKSKYPLKRAAVDHWFHSTSVARRQSHLDMKTRVKRFAASSSAVLFP
jgi:hypothetical protein